MALDAYIAGGGSLFLAVMIVLTQVLKWPKWVNYIWAALAAIWGVLALVR